MRKEELLQYYDYICKLALSKCVSQPDAEDLASETMLAAFACLHSGKSIEHPKTWLASTLMHKFNDGLRKKYNSPVTVNLDAVEAISDCNSDEMCYFETDEAADVRRELIYLAQTTREVLIRYYYQNQSVADIARLIGIPEGTVKSRLSSGRSKLKKGLERMESKKNHLPGHLNLSYSGSDSPKNEPISLVECDLIAQNLLALAYKKPLEMTGLADAIGIPTAYIEPIVNRLTDGELMIHTDGDKYYTDFVIYKPEDTIKLFEAQKTFVDSNFDEFWRVMDNTIRSVDNLEYSKTLNNRQLKKLERYAVMRVLQYFEIEGSKKELPSNPKRKDGGAWTAMGWYFPSGYDTSIYNSVCEYIICGGHRTSDVKNYINAKTLKLCEFDTTLWDNPRRFCACGFENYFNGGIIKLLWCVYNNKTVDNYGIKNTLGINNALIESIPALKEVGLLSDENGSLSVDIPVMDEEVYAQLSDIIQKNQAILISELGDRYIDFLRGAATEIPAHLKSVPEYLRYAPATRCIVMSAVREAYEKGLYLSDVDYCCPPVVLVYEKNDIPMVELTYKKKA